MDFYKKTRTYLLYFNELFNKIPFEYLWYTIYIVTIFPSRRDRYTLWYFNQDGTHETIPISIGRDNLVVLGSASFLEKAFVALPSKIKPSPLIVALHPSFAWTTMILLSQEVVRLRERNPHEYESHVSHILELMMQDYRRDAAKAMSVHELDAVAAGAYVKTLSLAKSGLKKRNFANSKRIYPQEALCLTFVARTIFDSFAHALESGQEIFFADAWHSEASIAGEAMSYPLRYVVLDKRGSYCYSIRGDRNVQSLARERFPWRTQMPAALLAQSWGVAPHVGEAVFRKYYREQYPSSRMYGFFSRTFSPARQSFFDAIASSRLGGRAVWVRGASHTPFSFPVRYKKTSIQPVPVDEIFKRIEVTVRAPEHFNSEDTFSHVAPLLEYNRFCNTPDSLYRYLSRRIHWMFLS